MENIMSTRQIVYAGSNKTFLSREDDEYSSIGWSISVGYRSDKDVWLSSDIRIADCSRHVNIDMDICLVDEQYHAIFPDKSQEKIKSRFEKIDTLINELVKYRASLAAAIDAYHSFVPEKTLTNIVFDDPLIS